MIPLVSVIGPPFSPVKVMFTCERKIRGISDNDERVRRVRKSNLKLLCKKQSPYDVSPTFPDDNGLVKGPWTPPP